MTRSRWLASVPVFLALLAPARAAEDSPLAQVPANAPIVISLHGVKRTTDRLVTMVKNAVPDLGPQVQTHIADFLKKGFFEGRKLRGLADDGPAFLVFTQLPKGGEDEEGPAMAVIARVTDYKAFRDSLMTEDERKTLKEDAKAGYEVAQVKEKDLYFVNRKAYAVVSADKKVAAELARNGKGKGLAGTLAPEIARRLQDADLAAYVDLAAVGTQYGKQIKSAQDFINTALERAPDAGLASKDKVDAIRAITDGLFQAVADGRSVLVTLDFRPDGAALHLEVNVATDSKTNSFLKTLKPAALAAMKSLPADYSTFIGFEFGPEAYKSFHPIMKALAASAGGEEDENKAAAKAISDALDDMLAAKPRRYLSASTAATQDELHIWDFADPAKGVAAELKLFRALKEGSEYQFRPLKEKPIIKAESQKYRDTKLHYVSMKWDLDKLFESFPGGEDAVKGLKKTMGSGQRLWFGVVDKKYVQVSARNWPTAAKRLDAYFDKKGLIGDKNKAFTLARENLPAKATMVSLTEAAPLAQMLGETIYGILKGQGMPINAPPAPAKKIPPSFLGVAVAFQSGQAGFDLWVPGGAVRDFRRVFEPMFKQDD
jgi:hypothetical protein